MTTHLKPKQEYIDRYDRMTVERCRDLIKRHSQPLENPPLIDGQKPTEKLVETVSKMALDWSLMFEKGHRYIKKGETIDRWMRDDQEKDELYESAKEPEGIRCLTCRSKMFVTHKMLWGGYEEPYRVLFMFDCPNGCLPRRSFYNDGEERKHKPDLCEKCSSELAVKLEDTKEKFITHYSCSSCGFAKTDEIERTANKENEPDPNFEADKARFCLSEKEGERWRQELANMEEMKKLVDDWKEKDENKDLYDAVAKIKKLTVFELEKLLAPVMEMGRDFQLPFTTHESKPDRKDMASTYDLTRLIKKTISDTNWRLMSDGISYRMGILTGRIRAYEKEEDLLKLVKK